MVLGENYLVFFFWFGAILGKVGKEVRVKILLGGVFWERFEKKGNLGEEGKHLAEVNLCGGVWRLLAVPSR